MRTGIVNLPLHYGETPRWLFERMKKLAKEIVLAIVIEKGSKDFLDRVSDPFWFQAFGCVLGFDWHSSGITTTVCGALKEGLKEVSKEIGLFVCGGKGKTSRKTPQEIKDIAEKRFIKIDPQELIYASKISAKVDNCALQDGYQLYHHCFIFNSGGEWVVIQQGMNPNNRWARRYHWLSSKIEDFVCEPHSAICCDYRGRVLNLVAKESISCRQTIAELACKNPSSTLIEFKNIKRLNLASHHFVSCKDIREENLKKILEETYQNKPPNFEKLLGIKGVGPKTLRALALISEIIYGKPSSFRDPVRFSFAFGGKDGHPYPVNRRNYDLSIDILKKAINQAKLERSERLSALKRLFAWLNG